MEKEFIPYEQALALKELGFDENCFGYYHYKKYYQNGLDFANIIFKHQCKLIDKSFILYPNDEIKRDTYILEKDKSNYFCKAPLYQQAFRWFRDKYNIWNWVERYTESDFYIFQIPSANLKKVQGYYKTYEKAELECLKKLIEIVKNK